MIYLVGSNDKSAYICSETETETEDGSISIIWLPFNLLNLYWDGEGGVIRKETSVEESEDSDDSCLKIMEEDSSVEILPTRSSKYCEAGDTLVKDHHIVSFRILI